MVPRTDLPTAVAGACFLTACLLSACSVVSKQWPTHRHDLFRSGAQLVKSELSDPEKVKTLFVRWSWHPGEVGDLDMVPANRNGTPRGFSASPVVYNDVIYVGHLNGHLYAINWDGKMIWKYPAQGSAPLVQMRRCNFSTPGIASTSVVVDEVGPEKKTLVIFGAPDPASNGGDGRLWAVDAKTGQLVWQSPALATHSPTDGTPGEQIGYSSPLVVGDRVYVGIADHCDSPLIAGKLFSVDTATGQQMSVLFTASAVRGGGIWSSPASTPAGDILVTTGNSCTPGSGTATCNTRPKPDHGGSMIRVEAATGKMQWKFQPVTWNLDFDSDWAATPALHLASCGTFAVSTQVDGFTHAIDVDPRGPPTTPKQMGFRLRRWSFRKDPVPFTSKHQWRGYPKPALALWEDVVIAVTGGWDVDVVKETGNKRLHALNGCTNDKNRVRWWVQPGATTLSPPSVTHGIVYVGTEFGALFAFADPTISPAAGNHCEYPGLGITPNPNFGTSLCQLFGFRVTPIPAMLVRVPLSGPIRTTPALAIGGDPEHGRVYVTTGDGFLHALQTR